MRLKSSAGGPLGTVGNPEAPLSYWHDSLEPGDSLAPRPSLPAATDADVAIVGAGFTGLWTAYYLLRADPKLRVVVLERDVAGFGASGRNGGWAVGDQTAPLHALEKQQPGSPATMVRAIHGAVDEIGAVAAREGIDCGYAKGGAVYVATNPFQLQRLRAWSAEYERNGIGDAYRMLSPRDTIDIVNAAGVCGGMRHLHAAAVHPARLARGLAVAVERLGGTIYEQTAVRSMSDGAARTDHGTVRADIVVRATEGYTAELDGHHRDLLPLGNFMIATEPIDKDVWDEIGLANRELFEIMVPMVSYGQRTADGRIALGGLGAPYAWGSAVPASPMLRPKTAERLRKLLVTTFPMLRGIEVTHHWGGIFGVPRDFRPSVGVDRAAKYAWAGGYVGVGVVASNLAGRTLADLITGADTDLTRLPWVDHRSRTWEPEPLRWLGVNERKLRARVVGRLDTSGLRRHPAVREEGEQRG